MEAIAPLVEDLSDDKKEARAIKALGRLKPATRVVVARRVLARPAAFGRGVVKAAGKIALASTAPDRSEMLERALLADCRDLVRLMKRRAKSAKSAEVEVFLRVLETRGRGDTAEQQECRRLPQGGDSQGPQVLRLRRAGFWPPDEDARTSRHRSLRL